MTETARVVVVGGGIWGCSIAYHLARAGVSDVLVLELEAQVAQARRWGLAAELIAPRDAGARVPLLETKGVKACAWVPTDGYAEPYTLAMALARAARRLGVRMRTQTPATAITLE